MSLSWTRNIHSPHIRHLCQESMDTRNIDQSLFSTVWAVNCKHCEMPIFLLLKHSYSGPHLINKTVQLWSWYRSWTVLETVPSFLALNKCKHFLLLSSLLCWYFVWLIEVSSSFPGINSCSVKNLIIDSRHRNNIYRCIRRNDLFRYSFPNMDSFSRSEVLRDSRWIRRTFITRW